MLSSFSQGEEVWAPSGHPPAVPPILLANPSCSVVTSALPNGAQALPQHLGDVGSLLGVPKDDGQESKGFSPITFHPQGKAL